MIKYILIVMFLLLILSGCGCFDPVYNPGA